MNKKTKKNETRRETNTNFSKWTDHYDRWEDEVTAAKIWHHEGSITFKLYSAMQEAFVCLDERDGELKYYKGSSTAEGVKDAYNIFLKRILPKWGYKPVTDEEVEEAVNLYNLVFKDFGIAIEKDNLVLA